MRSVKALVALLLTPKEPTNLTLFYNFERNYGRDLHAFLSLPWPYNLS